MKEKKAKTKREKWMKLLESVIGPCHDDLNIDNFDSLIEDALGDSAIRARQILEELIEDAIAEALKRKKIEAVVSVSYIKPEGPIAIGVKEKNTHICLSGNESMAVTYITVPKSLDEFIEALDQLVAVFVGNFKERLQKAVAYANRQGGDAV